VLRYLEFSPFFFQVVRASVFVAGRSSGNESGQRQKERCKQFHLTTDIINHVLVNNNR